MNKETFLTNLKQFIDLQIDNVSKQNQMVGFFKPIISRVVDRNYHKISNILGFITDSNGNIEVNEILDEMLVNLENTQPFSINTSFIGNIELGGGKIKVAIPYTNKDLILDSSDIRLFKEMLTNKS
jgi:hypothetical protein